MASTDDNQFQWHYIGHYGQLGPLSLDQMMDLVRDGVIERETYVWRSGLTDWLRAALVPEFEPIFAKFQPDMPPPPPPSTRNDPLMTPFSTATASQSPPAFSMPIGSASYSTPAYMVSPPMALVPVSDRSRVLAGVLQLIIPGVGRMYMGCIAQGLLQFFLSPCGLGWLWAVIDGILILTGSVKFDGYGRRLPE